MEVTPVDIPCVTVQDRTFVVLVQHRDLVLVVCHVKVDVPAEISLADDVQTQIQLDTVVEHVSDIVVGAAVAAGKRNIDEAQHVGGLSAEELGATGEAAFEYVELHTGVEVAVGLPGDVLVADRAEGQGWLTVEVVDGVGVGVAVVSDGVVALLPP